MQRNIFYGILLCARYIHIVKRVSRRYFATRIFRGKGSLIVQFSYILFQLSSPTLSYILIFPQLVTTKREERPGYKNSGYLT